MRGPLCQGPILAAAALLFWSHSNRAAAPGQTVASNYDESQVGSYTLPDPLLLANGKRVLDPQTFVTTRRPEIIRLFEENQFGRSPGRPPNLAFDVFDRSTPALNGKALRRQVTIYFSSNRAGPKMDVALYLPAAATKPVPLLLSLNFSGNSVMVNDSGLKAGEVWSREGRKIPASQGMKFGDLPVEKILSHGFGAAAIYYGDIEPDFPGGFAYGVRHLFLKPGQAGPAADDWGAIAAWAWGLSRAMDYFEQDSAVDARRVALLGISRLGKTVLWAGAQDARFAMVIASCSGEGGAALSRRNYGETVKNLTTHFPYWFCANYQKYADRVDQLPVDANMLLALIAPRPLFLQTGDQDRWADPRGEFLAAVAAGPVYRLLGAQDLGTDQMPAPGQPIRHTIEYFEHRGGHGALPADWAEFLSFMELYLKPSRN